MEKYMKENLKIHIEMENEYTIFIGGEYYEGDWKIKE